MLNCYILRETTSLCFTEGKDRWRLSGVRNRMKPSKMKQTRRAKFSIWIYILCAIIVSCFHQKKVACKHEWVEWWRYTHSNFESVGLENPWDAFELNGWKAAGTQKSYVYTEHYLLCEVHFQTFVFLRSVTHVTTALSKLAAFTPEAVFISLWVDQAFLFACFLYWWETKTYLKGSDSAALIRCWGPGDHQLLAVWIWLYALCFELS